MKLAAIGACSIQMCRIVVSGELPVDDLGGIECCRVGLAHVTNHIASVS